MKLKALRNFMFNGKFIGQNEELDLDKSSAVNLINNGFVKSLEEIKEEEQIKLDSPAFGVKSERTPKKKTTKKK